MITKCGRYRSDDTKYAASLRHLIYAKEDLIKYMKYDELCSRYKPEREYCLNKPCNVNPYTVATKEDLIRYIKNEENSVYGIARQIEDDFLAKKLVIPKEGESKVYYFTKDVEIKKKVGKKGSCMQYNFILYGTHAFLTVENYDEDCNLSADFILSIAQICYRCEVDKLIFRDHKVIAISKDKRYCGKDEKTNESIWKQKSYVADCMDVDDYNPYIGATIAINKCVMDSCYKKDSKSHLRRLREKIDMVNFEEP